MEGSNNGKLSIQNGAAILKDVASGRLCYGKLNFVSCRGMYFESESAFMPGNMDEIQFGIAPLIRASESYMHRAKVYWCMLLSEHEPIAGIGLA
jgi:hypothetical protein